MTAQLNYDHTFYGVDLNENSPPTIDIGRAVPVLIPNPQAMLESRRTLITFATGHKLALKFD